MRIKVKKPAPAGAVLAALVLVLSLALVPAALAGKAKPGGGGGNSGGTISLVMVKDANANGLPNYGDTVTFAVSTTATTQPYVTLDCYQGGTLVYQASNGIFAISLNQMFVLQTPAWQAGAADCTAYLQNWDSYSRHHTVTNLASLNFSVGA
jgi:hypothetical protein